MGQDTFMTMAVDALKKNYTCIAFTIMICLIMYYMLYSATLISTKPKEMRPETRPDESKKAFHHDVKDHEDRTQAYKSYEKTPPFRKPGGWNRILTNMSNVIHGQSLRMPQKNINSKLDFKKTYTIITKPKMPEVFYGDCYAYSAGGVSKRPPEVLEKNGCAKRLPKGMIIGVKKCGTMMLTHYLSLHPLIAIQGEIEFPTGQNFTTQDVEKWKARMQWSSPRMFSMAGKPIVRVNWTSYLTKRLEYLLDDKAKLILIIRDPVVRAISDYVHTNVTLVKNGSQALQTPLNDILIESRTGKVNAKEPLIARGRYINRFRSVTAYYGPDRLLVLDGEAFIQDPLPIMIQVERFLGLSPFFERKHFQRNPETGFYCANVPERPNFKCANPKIKGRPHPEVDEEISKKLYDYYSPFNLELAKEAGLYFQWLFK